MMSECTVRIIARESAKHFLSFLTQDDAVKQVRVLYLLIFLILIAMKALALNLSNLSVPSLIERCREIVVEMTGNANFPAPVPALADISAAITQLEIYYQTGLTGDHAAKALQKQQRKTVTDLMVQLMSYVQLTSGDSEEKARSSGIGLKRTPQPHNTIGQPQNVHAIPLPTAGEATVRWNGVPHRKSYLVYVTTDLADVSNRTKWTLLGTTGARSFVATGVAGGVKNAIFIIAVGARNIQSAPSDPAIVTPAA
jgi:hypothetical protein